MKRLWVLVTIVMLMTAALAEIPATPIYECGAYTYTLYEDGTAQIVSWDGAEQALEVPASLDGHTVVSVSECAFADCEGLVSVAFPDTVLEIGDEAFTNCVNLRSVSLPASLVRLGSAAFNGCEGLISVALPGSLTVVGANPFSRCANLHAIVVDVDNTELYTQNGALLTRTDDCLVCYPLGLCTPHYEVPAGVRRIGAMAFNRDLYLESVRLPASLSSIGEGAFDGCEALKTMNLPAGIHTIGRDAMRCPNLVLTHEEGEYDAQLVKAVDIPSDDL